MNNRDVQLVLAAAGYYDGGIDGAFGRMSWAAVKAVETDHTGAYRFDPAQSTGARRCAAAVQVCLDKLGYEPGEIDGWLGPNTTEALNLFLFKAVHGRDEVIDRSPLPSAPQGAAIPRQSEVAQVYGTPGPQIEARLVTLRLPFKLRIDWNLRQKTDKIRVHELAAAPLERALIEVHRSYGEARWRELGLDRYAGAYNHRKVRGGTSWSMHAYGCAIDFYAAPNGLRTRCPEALFCGPEYKDFLDIMEENEWLPAIRLWGADAMHFQRARL